MFRYNPRTRIPEAGIGRRQSAARLLLAVLLLTEALLACDSPTKPSVTPVKGADRTLTYVRPAGPAADAGGETGMRLALSEGSELTAPLSSAPLADSQPLSPDETQALWDRLPELEGPDEDQQQLRLPPETLPAPRPGETIEHPFPPPDSDVPIEPVETSTLHVLRYSPEGDVDLAPHLSITFDQPMVALTAHGDLAAKDSPVEITPLPEGAWRWIGTKTLVFQPTTRFPMATEYAVRVQEGTTSATGGRLDEEVSWTFRTPAPRMTKAHPSEGPAVREPLLFVAFDQRVEPTLVLDTIRLKAGGEAFRLALADRQEVSEDGPVAQLAKGAQDQHWLAFRSTEPLPHNTTVTVDVGPGTPSAEGPRKTEEVQSFSFRTFGPLEIIESKCGWDDVCRPMMPWWIRFTNPLDEDSFSDSLVEIEPDLPGGKLSIFGDRLQIEGRSQGRTTYRVRLSDDIRDRFGQPLGQDKTVTFKVGSAEPVMYSPSDTFVVLDSPSIPTYSVFSINYSALRVQAYRVTPADWPTYLEYLKESSRTTESSNPPGTLAIDREIRVEGASDSLVETVIDLAPALDGNWCHLILVIEPAQPFLQSVLRMRTRNPVIRVWIQATQVGLDAFVHDSELLVWVTSLADGSALSDVDVELLPGKAQATSGSDGLTRLSLSSAGDGEPAYLVARNGADVAFLPENPRWWSRGWPDNTPGDEYRWYVMDDRKMYRPGEQVHVKGWIRIVEYHEGADAFVIPDSKSSVSYELSDSRGNQLLDGRLEVNALGGFDTAFVLPEGMNLGTAQLKLTLSDYTKDGVSHSHRLQVQEFRRPEFEVSTSAGPGPHFVGAHTMATVEATYYAGGPLPEAEVAWNVSSRRGSYRPPGWDEFTFGIWSPWWRGYYDWGIPGREEATLRSYEGLTDAAGKHHLRIDFEAADPPLPTSVTAQATVMDVNRQAWSSSTHLLVHPADLYVGMRTHRTFVQRGEPLKVEAIVTDLDGTPVEDRPIDMVAVRLDWMYSKGKWSEEEVDEQRCTVGSTGEPVLCVFDTEAGGTYRISATVQDAQGRSNLSQITVWVSGGQRPTVGRVEQEEASLIPDQKEYKPGDFAEILVQSPFAPAEGLLTLRRGGIVHCERFRMDQQTHTLRVPIQEAHIPNVHVQVDLVGSAPRLNSAGDADESLPARPAFASGSLNLAVPARSRTLAVEVAPEDTELEPGGETVVHLSVRDANGAAVEGAEAAVVVVDEAILALTGYQLLDPIAVFYRNRSEGVTDYHSRAYILLVDPDRLVEDDAADQVMGLGAPMATRSAPGMVMEKAAPAAAPDAAATPEPIRTRTDFDPLASFEPVVPTDADGHASVHVKLPDNLTRYRVMAVVVSGSRSFGQGEATITGRLPLMVRPSPPRFLNFGDRFELPVVVQNQTREPLQVEVAVRATNLRLSSSAGVRVTVPAMDRREVRFPFATESAGTARLQVVAAAGQWADAAQASLPVYTPATTEAFAVYGTIDDGAIAQPVEPPTDAYVQFGGLEVSTSSTALQALSDAVLYLVEYPFECSEQLASRVLAVAALRDVLTAFQAEGLPDEEELLQAVQRDIGRLQGLQNRDGGFPVWRRGRSSLPFHSIHALHALARARQKGFQVPDSMITGGLDYVRSIEEKWPSWYSEDVRNTLTAYALYVRSHLGDLDVARARKLVRDVGASKLQSEALGWLLSVLTGDEQSSAETESIRRFLGNSVVETAGAANFVTSYREEDGYLLLASNRRADGVILEAMISDQPRSDLIVKLVKGLLAHQKRGRWRNTQENVFILLALDKYFGTYETQTPEFVARVWLGEQYLGDFQFVGRTTDYQSVKVPMSYLTEAQDLVLSKDGPGRLYYRLGLRYAPTSLDLGPLDQGFAILRSYEAIDDPQDVTQDEDGIWHFRAGARVRVRLTMVAPSRRYHVALVDPMPAGLESLNPALAVTGSIPQAPDSGSNNRYWWWRWTWYEHQNLRDERVEAFASLLWDGIHRYTYVARAITPGEFVVPPTKAEEMYSPEVFGRGSTDRVIVE